MPENGRLPDSDLSRTLLIGRLRHDAAASADRMALAFYEDLGLPMKAVSPADTYRSYEQQVEARARVGDLAAVPGTSNHGWGVAVDFGTGMNDWNSPAQKWFAANGRKYGWVTPGWADPTSPNFQKNEPWHKEYHPELDRMKDAAQPRYPLAGEVGFGQSGPEVRNAQELLNANLAPENRIEVDGGYGWASLLATVKFQRSRGMTVTGTVGPQTLERLKSAIDQENEMTLTQTEKAQLSRTDSMLQTRIGDIGTTEGLTIPQAIERLLVVTRRTEGRIIAEQATPDTADVEVDATEVADALLERLSPSIAKDVADALAARLAQ